VNEYYSVICTESAVGHYRQSAIYYCSRVSNNQTAMKKFGDPSELPVS